MTDNSKFWRELDPSTQNYCLENDINKAEKKMKEAKELQEERLEELFDKENMARLKAMNVKDMSWQDVEILNEIKKRHSNINKFYDGSDTPQAEGAVPDTSLLRSQIINTANELIPLIQKRGVAVQPIPEGASLQNILSFCYAFRDALKNSQTPTHLNEIASVEIESPESRYTKAELLSTRQTIDEMLENGEYLEG